MFSDTFADAVYPASAAPAAPIVTVPAGAVVSPGHVLAAVVVVVDGIVVVDEGAVVDVVALGVMVTVPGEINVEARTNWFTLFAAGAWYRTTTVTRL